jgi:hypothetical protein
MRKVQVARLFKWFGPGFIVRKDLSIRIQRSRRTLERWGGDVRYGKSPRSPGSDICNLLSPIAKERSRVDDDAAPARSDVKGLLLPYTCIHRRLRVGAGKAEE